MSDVMIGLLGIVVLMLTLFLTAIPVAFAMAIVGFVGFCCVISTDAGLSMVGSSVWSTFSKYGFTSIPLFIFMGQIAFSSGVNEKLYAAAHRWIGHIRGGLAQATLLGCAGFSAICGSNTATAATMSTVALPEMKRYRYNPLLSVGAVASGSTLGVVIPPSVVFIIIGLSTSQSIGKLFYGGLCAGLLLLALMMLTVTVVCRLKPHWGPAGPNFTLKEKIRSLAGAYEMLLLFLAVIFGLFKGWFTPTEAGAIGSLLALLIGVIQRKLPWKAFLASIDGTLRASCMVMMIVTGATILGRFLTITRIPNELAEWVVTLPIPPWAVISVIFLLYGCAGMIMDALALLLITIPIFFPVADSLGYDPLWFSVVITVITTLGAITPPVGATTYVVAAMAKGDVAMHDVFKGVMVFIPAYLLCVVLLMLFPQIATYLPSLMH
jgi:tripartite ATP-independent transporter DctM subunit